MLFCSVANETCSLASTSRAQPHALDFAVPNACEHDTRVATAEGAAPWLFEVITQQSDAASHDSWEADSEDGPINRLPICLLPSTDTQAMTARLAIGVLPLLSPLSSTT